MQNILVSIKTGARLLSISVRTVHRYLDLGIFQSVSVGRRRLLRYADLLSFAENGLSLEKLRNVKASIEQRADEK